jgi:hypothetical protein
MVLYGLAHEPFIALGASMIAGATWIAAVATLNVSAQVALPDWVRGRGLALYATVFFGCLALGSVAWGEVAAWAGLPAAHFLAAAGAVIAIPLTWRGKLQAGAGVDLTPSMHWPAPITKEAIDEDRGPVLIMVEYRIDPKNRAAFLKALARLEDQRPRDGAYTGASSTTPRRKGVSSRRSWSDLGWSTCASMNGSPMPIGSSRTRLTVFTSATHPR